MDASASAELESIKRELRSIISELDSIAAGVRKDFVGIGNERCANSIESVANHYRGVLRKLQNMDTGTVTESFAKAHSGGGGRLG